MRSTEILSIHTPALFQAAVERAALLLRQGQAVAVPTETVYGLAANAFDAEAVGRIFAAKGRPASNPLIVHVADWDMALACAEEWPAAAEALARAFWPGPLTMVAPKSNRIPNVVTAGGSTVGIRWPGHPFMQALIRACGFPLAAPSANLSNQLSPTTAAHVQKGLGGRIPLIVDGGAANVGIESTVLDLTASPPAILRPGIISSASIAAVIGEVAEPGARRSEGGPLKSPGMLSKHYAPRARLAVLEWQSDADLAAKLGRLNAPVGKVRLLAHSVIPGGLPPEQVSVIPHDAEAFARALYAELHHCDELGAELIVVEELPDLPEWQGIRDRLRRAGSEAA